MLTTSATIALSEENRAQCPGKQERPDEGEAEPTERFSGPANVNEKGGSGKDSAAATNQTTTAQASETKGLAERFRGRHDKQPQRARRYIMLMPTLFRNDWFDDFMDGFPTELTRTAGARDNGLMKTDVKENADTFVIDMDLPGFNKEDVKAQVKDGYLVIEAVKNADKEDKDEDGKYIRRERFYGTCKRSFYVGEQVTEEDIKAKFENGVLTLTIPKEAKKEVEAPKYIAIEG